MIARSDQTKTVTVEDIVSPCRFCKGVVIISYAVSPDKYPKIEYGDASFSSAICRDCGKSQVTDF